MSINASEILLAFSDAEPFLDAIAGTPPEIFGISRDFRGKSWVDITAAACIQHSDALVMMDLKPLAYFLPAFLVAALQQPSSVVAESLVYFVCSPTLDTIIPLLSGAQHKAVLGVVEAVLDIDHGFFAEQTDAFLLRTQQYRDIDARHSR